MLETILIIVSTVTGSIIGCLLAFKKILKDLK